MGGGFKSGLIRSHQSGFAAMYRITDVLLILIVLSACVVFFGQELSKDWLIAGMLAAISFLFIAESLGLYRSWRVAGFIQLVYLIVFVWSIVCALLLLLAYFTKAGESYSRLVVGSWFLLVLFLLVGERYLLRKALFYIRSRDGNTRSAVIIGVTDAGVKLARNLVAEPQLGIRLKGFYHATEADQYSESPADLVPVLGGVADAVADAKAGKIDQIYIALPMREELRIAEILQALADTTATVHILPDFLVYNLLHARWQSVGNSNLLSIYDSPINEASAWLKRLEDLVLSSVILLLMAPLMLLIALAIKVTSPGPVIFKQLRYGLGGRSIMVWKFRTMSTQDNGDRVVQARRNDARVTFVGGILRRTSLDELPQFFNVLQGSMSIVGPRPHAVAHNEQYRSLVDGYMLRHKVKPGITGWAQVNGWRGETNTLEKMHKRVEHDLDYIRHWSIWLDLRIVLMTIVKGFVNKNAY